MDLDDHAFSSDMSSSNISSRPVLVLDLDHTLIHSIKQSEWNLSPYKQQQSTEHMYVSTKYDLLIAFRPGCQEFIHQCSNVFDLYVYTNASMNYAVEILHELDPGQVFLNSDTRLVASKGAEGTRGLKNLETLELECKVSLQGRRVLILDDYRDIWIKKDWIHVYQVNSFVVWAFLASLHMVFPRLAFYASKNPYQKGYYYSFHQSFKPHHPVLSPIHFNSTSIQSPSSFNFSIQACVEEDVRIDNILDYDTNLARRAGICEHHLFDEMNEFDPDIDLFIWKNEMDKLITNADMTTVKELENKWSQILVIRACPIHSTRQACYMSLEQFGRLLSLLDVQSELVVYQT
ncbi:MAG: hypothetical protein Sylvanvirus16_7 [Sylvanvirus sp.]|uniref:protein-serine/threonine phosphatase n=1 Tax=Sylvanvirus sp. TaxID=2487774 RepID=A0A3G5AIG5_9VIRU|nr:MAG: hypothetical protein Sylvanvirus16_7 [Sylvanvirus sp.]